MYLAHGLSDFLPFFYWQVLSPCFEQLHHGWVRIAIKPNDPTLWIESWVWWTNLIELFISMIEAYHYYYISLDSLNKAFVKTFSKVLWTQYFSVLGDTLYLIRIEQSSNLAWTNETVYFLVKFTSTKLVFFKEENDELVLSCCNLQSTLEVFVKVFGWRIPKVGESENGKFVLMSYNTECSFS